MGWFLSLAAITVVTLLFTGGKPPSSGSVPSDAALWVRFAIGFALVLFGLYRRSLLGKPPRKVKKPAKWESGIDNMSLWFAALLAPITQPWGLIAAGVTAVMMTDARSAADIVLLVVFVLLATSTYLVLEVFAMIRPERAHAIALGLRAWIQAHTAQALAYGSALIGLFLMGSSIYHLVT